ncbi:RNA polymerase sigma factor [Pukyongiella litopenaei]|uniref:RNA polymerase sigma factor n=1 Tax=Pukyongiella litopenaei TaxID=2605946 RepID=A0A2S0MMB5_9RHOB|nr:RNA polymerase sigma factor [Pukyongiella litopenaei]AVO37022.1 RNA polymerase sigma factor [Pukyongiella litopenaei]
MPSELNAPADIDAALLQRFARGDARSAQVLTGRLTPRAFAVALRMLGDRAEAEDVAQDAMLRLWRMAPDWKPGQAQVSTWLLTVVINLCRDRLRRRGRVHVGIDAVPDPADPAPSAPERLQDSERAAALQNALMRLPERQRQAVVLRHIEGLPNPRIAEILGISVEAVESLTSRGRRALSAMLAGRRAELGFADD